jgi:hypothetical protein
MWSYVCELFDKVLIVNDAKPLEEDLDSTEDLTWIKQKSINYNPPKDPFRQTGLALKKLVFNTRQAMMILDNNFKSAEERWKQL